MKKEKRNCYINWSQLYKFVTKYYELTKIGTMTKNGLDISKIQWELADFWNNSKAFGHNGHVQN